MPAHARAARHDDAEAITAIYNQGIEDRCATFETRLRSPAEVALWLEGRFPVVVVEVEGAVAAFASTSEYRPRDCYRHIAEVSVYVARQSRGRGQGTIALLGVLDAASAAGFGKLVSRVFVDNAASRRLLARCGFREVGVYRRHGQLDGQWRDVIVVEALL